MGADRGDAEPSGLAHPTNTGKDRPNERGGWMSRTKRLREAVRVYLAENGRSHTVDIFDHLNDRFSWGATMNQVGNILAKDNRFEKVGHVRDFFRGARYTVCVWDLASDARRESTAQA